MRHLTGAVARPSAGRRRSTAAAILAAAALLATLAAPAQARIIHQERSLYSTILIDKQGPVVCLQFSVRRDQRNQSCVNQRRPREMVFVYARMVMTSLLLDPRPERILILGLGGGTLPMAFDELLPEAEIDVVEIDPAVVRVAREYFGFAPSERVDVFAQDGRVFVKRAAHQGEKYDLVILDAFNGEYIPEHLMTQEFLEEVQNLLDPGSVMVANTFSISELYHHESATYAAVFGEFYNLRADDTGNRLIIARNGPLPPRHELEQRAAMLQGELEPYGVDYERLLPLMTTETDWDADARILTDQYSPANLMRNE